MSRMRVVIFTVFMCMIVLPAWSQDKVYHVAENIAYYPEEARTANKYIAERCVLDVYYPGNSALASVVIWFHGGGLTVGQKEIPHALREKGICLVGVNYRLTPHVQVDDCIEDAAAAVAWVFRNISRYGGDPDRIFIAGHSAGGYLVAMVGLDKTRLADHEIDANKIAGIVPFSGQMITHFAERKRRGINDTQPIVDKMAPLYHVRPDAPPLLLITGDRELEMLGRYEENAYMMRMMTVCGHKSTRLLELQGYGHGMAEPAFPLLLNEIHSIVNK